MGQHQWTIVNGLSGMLDFAWPGDNSVSRYRRLIAFLEPKIAHRKCHQIGGHLNCSLKCGFSPFRAIAKKEKVDGLIKRRNL